MNSSAQFLTPPVTGSADLNISRLDADVGNGHSAFLQHIHDSSTEYSVIGKDLEGKIVLWNEGARRLYGYEPEEVVGKANAVILHTPEDVAAGKPAEILEVALRTAKWEGIIRLRKNGQRFTARVVITPRRVATGRGLGLTRKIVELHGGAIGVESEVGKGSNFTVVLPLVLAHG